MAVQAQQTQSIEQRMGEFVEREIEGIIDEEEGAVEAQAIDEQEEDLLAGEDDLLDEDELDEEADAESTASAGWDPITIVSDGSEFTVEDRDEAIRLMQFGKTFQQRNQALIQEKHQLEPMRAHLMTQLQQYQQALPQLANLLQTAAGPEPQPEQFQDPSEYLWAKDQWTRNMQQVQLARQEQQRVQYEQQAMLHQRMAMWQQQQAAALAEKVPEWQDQEVATTEVQQMMDYGQSMGMSSQELNGLNDHRMVLILRDAARYRALQSEGSEAVVRAKQKAAAPGSRSATTPKSATRARVKRQRAKLKKSGREQDAVPLMVKALGIK